MNTKADWIHYTPSLSKM